MAHSEDMECRRLREYIELGESAIVSVADSLLDNKNNDFITDFQFTEPIAQLTNDLLELIKLEKHLKRTNDASIVTERQIMETFNTENVDIDNVNVGDMFEQNRENLEQNSEESDVERNDNYNKLKSILSVFSGDAQQTQTTNTSNIDDDLQALDTETNDIPIDPFSKLPINIPVRNKRCHHVYDRDQLEQVIKAKAGTAGVRCAFIGCTVRNITMKDVILDLKLKATIDKLRRRND